MRLRIKSCGKEGRQARGLIRDLVGGREVDRRQIYKAIIHVEGCGHCKEHIKSAIRSAKEKGQETDYLDSVRETLQEVRERFEEIRRTRRERSL